MPGNNLWTMTHQSNIAWTGGGCLYKCCPSGGEISANLTSLYLWGDNRKKKKRSKFIEKLKIQLFLFFSRPFPLLQIPAWMCRRARGMHQDETWRPSLWNPPQVKITISFQPQPGKRRAGPLLTALGTALFIVRKLWRNIVAWENALRGWWKWTVGATTKGEIRPIFSVGGTHKSENNAHYYRKNNSSPLCS